MGSGKKNTKRSGDSFYTKKNKGRHCKEAGLELDVCMAGCTIFGQNESNIGTSLDDFFDLAIGRCGR